MSTQGDSPTSPVDSAEAPESASGAVDAPQESGSGGGSGRKSSGLAVTESNTKRDLQGFGAKIKATWTPPEIWSQPRPPLAHLLAYAKRGAWGPEEGTARTAAVAYCYVVALPVACLAYALAWTAERPTRLCALLLLIAAAAWWLNS